MHAIRVIGRFSAFSRRFPLCPDRNLCELRMDRANLLRRFAMRMKCEFFKWSITILYHLSHLTFAAYCLDPISLYFHDDPIDRPSGSFSDARRSVSPRDVTQLPFNPKSRLDDVHHNESGFLFGHLRSLSHRAFLYPASPRSIFFSLFFFPPASFAAPRIAVESTRNASPGDLRRRCHPRASRSFLVASGRKTILARDRYISMSDSTWIRADQLSSSVWRYTHEIRVPLAVRRGNIAEI